MPRHPNSIHLGFEVGGGAPVSIPFHHLICCGLTRLSGKTTTLEALIARSGRRAIVFSTKRGEKEFEGATEVQPFYREHVDWVYVQSLLEAALTEKLKLERSWIIRVTHAAKTLDQVHANVREALETAKGFAQSMYTNLNAYFDLVLPQIHAANFSGRLKLAAGLNVMHLEHLSSEVQALVIRAVLEEIYAQYKNTITVIPESWKFIPEGRGNPVKQVAQKLIREGGVLGNYVYLDSQEITSVDKSLLKSVDVWLLGRQREINEIKRMIEQVPVKPKPKAEEIATLEVGQFIACFGNQVHKVYVQPLWLEAEQARLIATGEAANDQFERNRQADGVVRRKRISGAHRRRSLRLARSRQKPDCQDRELKKRWHLSHRKR